MSRNVILFLEIVNRFDCQKFFVFYIGQSIKFFGG
jgi:hypothetical protein